MVRIPAWLAGMAWRPPAVTEREALIWGPADGNAEFRGGEGADLLWLDGLTLQQLRAGLRLDQEEARLRIEGNGTVSFIAADGSPASVGGELSTGGAMLRFSGIGRLAFLW